PLVPKWNDLAADALGPLIRLPRHPLVMARLGLPGVLPARLLARVAFSGVRARALFAGLAAHSVLPLDAPLTASFALMFAVVNPGGTLDEIADSEAQIARGTPAERPFILVGQQSLFDPSRAPAGKQTVWAYCHIPNGSTFDMTERMEAQIERFAPGFRERVLARSVMGPAEIHRHNENNIGGDIGGGANTLFQFMTRPFFRLDPYATSARDVYLFSSSTPPGGGVHGMCGYHA